ncbi:MAG: CBS domain-containing protein [Gemmatales bacterium]|nr:MAG: CBS domain-containing protein [Gemmatales bacterium]
MTDIDLLDKTAADLMTEELVVLKEQTSLQEAGRILLRQKVSGAPVVDEEGRCVGVLSASDFVRWLEKETPHIVVAFDPFYRIEQTANVPDEPISKYMTRNVVTVPPDKKIADIARMMLDAHIHRVIVVDSDNKPRGIVSSTDLLAALAYAK